MEATKFIYKGFTDNQILYIRDKLGLLLNEVLCDVRKIFIVRYWRRRRRQETTMSIARSISWRRRKNIPSWNTPRRATLALHLLEKEARSLSIQSPASQSRLSMWERIEMEERITRPSWTIGTWEPSEVIISLTYRASVLLSWPQLGKRLEATRVREDRDGESWAQTGVRQQYVDQASIGGKSIHADFGNPKQVVQDWGGAYQFRGRGRRVLHLKVRSCERGSHRWRDQRGCGYQDSPRRSCLWWACSPL